MQKISATQSKEITQAILNQQNFIIYDVANMGDIVVHLENIIEQNNMSCRIYTKNRVAAAAVGILHFGTGVATLAGIAAHNLATRNPDFEIAKDYIHNQIFVSYKK